MWWQEHNCFRCWKYQEEGSDREKMRCKIAFDVDMGYIGVELPCRTNRITESPDCPYRQEKRPNYGRNKQNPVKQKLFDFMEVKCASKE
jgi:hypothetical protein